MSDEERYYAMQDDSAIENHPAFERGYQAGLCDGRTEERDRIAALETEMAELQARSDPDALRLWKKDVRAAANVRCASLEAALYAIVPRLIDALRNAADVDAGDVYEMLAVAGVIQHVLYDPEQHGEIEDAEIGSEVWIFTDFGDRFAEGKEG